MRYYCDKGCGPSSSATTRVRRPRSSPAPPYGITEHSSHPVGPCGRALNRGGRSRWGVGICAEDGGGGGGPTPETFLEKISTIDVCDEALCALGDDNEFEFRGMTPGGTTEAIRIEGIPATGVTTLHIHLIYALPPMWVGGENGTITARETDWPSADDLFYFHYTTFPSVEHCSSIPLGSNVGGTEDKLRWFDLREDACDQGVTLLVQFTW